MAASRHQRPSFETMEDRSLMSADSAPSIVLSSVSPYPRTDSHSALRESEILNQVQSSNNRVVFIGDSNVEYWSTLGQTSWYNTIVPNFGPGNFGVASETTQNLLWRLRTGELARHPDVVVLEIGMNNVLFSETGSYLPDKYSNQVVSDTVAGISAVLHTITKISPETKILLLGVFPVGATSSDPQRREVQAINTQLAHIADGNSVTFLNADSSLLNPNGTRPRSPDGIHMNSSQYNALSNAILGPLTDLAISQMPVVDNVVVSDIGRQESEIVLSFSKTLDVARATDSNNYALIRMGPDNQRMTRSRSVSFVSATYDPASKTVTLVSNHRLHAKYFYELVVNGQGPNGVASAGGTLLNGSGTGVTGSDYVTMIQGPAHPTFRLGRFGQGGAPSSIYPQAHHAVVKLTFSRHRK